LAARWLGVVFCELLKLLGWGGLAKEVLSNLKIRIGWHLDYI
jgi:hypothetical protein